MHIAVITRGVASFSIEMRWWASIPLLGNKMNALNDSGRVFEAWQLSLEVAAANLDSKLWYLHKFYASAKIVQETRSKIAKNG